MQATIHRFDEASGAGAVVLDDGRSLPFSAEVFAASGLRLVRPGQRVSIEWQEPVPPEPGPGLIRRLWIVGIGPGEIIR